MGCVYLPHRKTSIYWMKYRGVDGKIYRESTGKDRKEEAKTELRKREGKISDGVPVTPADGRLTFADAVAAVVDDYKINRRRSIDSLEGRIKHLSPVFGRLRMATITGAMMRAFAAQRQAASASNAEINRELAIIRRAFRLAKKDGRLHHVPDFPMLRENNARKGFFEREQYESVRNHLPADLRPVIEFAYLTGWRVKSEVLPLEWQHVNREAKTIRLDTSKNGEARTINYGQLAALVALIDQQWTAHVALQKKGIIRPSVFLRDGERIKDFRGAWTAAVTAAGVPGRLVHDLRRTAVRNLTRAGVPDTVAMKVTGHKTRSVFDRYNITSETDVADALGKLDPTWTSGGQSGAKAGQGGQS
jgi:integrase